MTTSVFDKSMAAPSMGLFGLEGLRATLEYASMHFMDKSRLREGDGHPVVVFPGLASDGQSTAPLRSLCGQLGYAAYDWGRGTNLGPQGQVEAWLDELTGHVLELTAHHPERISLVGWSLGGIYAREVAKRLGGRARQVITIGTPFADTSQTNVGWVYKAVNASEALLDEALTQLAVAPDVPTTSIYSRSDGIVAWSACLQAGGSAHTQNIEVEGSHCGLGWNPAVLAIVADRLSQPERGWRQYS